MASSQTSPRQPLYQRTFLAVLVCGVLYLLVLFALPLILDVFGIPDPWNILLMISINILLWCVVMPFQLLLPNGRGSFREYLASLSLKSPFPVSTGILIGILVVIIWGEGFLLLDLFYGRFDPIPGILSRAVTWLHALNTGVFEEIALRGIILTILLKRFKDWPAILICSALFGLGQAVKMLLGLPLLDGLVEVIYAFLMGVIFSYIFVKTGSLIPCLLAHVLMDAFGMLLLEPLYREGVSLVQRSTILLVGGVSAAFTVIIAIPLLQFRSVQSRASLVGELENEPQ